MIVHWNSVVVSIEQAYTLFLGYPESLSLEEYQVYSTLMRSGFHLLKCDAERKYQAKKIVEEPVDEEAIMVWSILSEMLGKPNRPIVSDGVPNAELYDKVRTSMLNSSSIIKSQEHPKELGVTRSGKRKSPSTDETSGSKRMKTSWFFNDDIESRSKLNKFKQIFKKIDVIQSTIDEEAATPVEDPCRFKLLFDLFPCDGTTFKKSRPVEPDYRIFVGR